MKHISGPNKSRSVQGADQAGLLAYLTRNLADCCLGKEAEIFGRYGLSAGEGRLLLIIAEAGSLTPSAAAQKMSVARSRLTPLAQSLVEQGYLERAGSATDRRAHELKLTPSGTSIARRAAEFREVFHAKLLEGFAPHERERLLKALSDLHERMQALREEMKQPTDNRS